MDGSSYRQLLGHTFAETLCAWIMFLWCHNNFELLALNRKGTKQHQSIGTASDITPLEEEDSAPTAAGSFCWRVIFYYP